MKAEDILDLTLKSLTRDRSPIPDSTAVRTKVDEFLKIFPDLEVFRDSIISKALEILVTTIEKAEELVDPSDYQEWLDNHDRSEWKLWPWLYLYMRERLRRPSAILEELDRSTDRVLDLLGDPKRAGLWDRRGLVMGHVQSGKTQHYTALAAKAIDAGYKVVIILSGIHENLRQQTQERIEECITGKNSRKRFEPFGVRQFAEDFRGMERPALEVPDVNSLTSAAGDFRAGVNQSVLVAMGETPVVLVIKKNVSILRNVLEKIRGSNSQYSPFQHPLLVIDDEADHSSINTAKIDPDTDPTRTNELIRKLLWACDKVAFVGYTATPYANIFMEETWEPKSDSRILDNVGSDLFPRAFIIGLNAPDNYIGPDSVFGYDADETLGIPGKSPLDMYEEVDDADQWLPPRHKSNFPVTEALPGSLTNALKSFVLSVAARMAIGQLHTHCSMLVHVTRFNAVQAQVMDQVKPFVQGLRVVLENSVEREQAWNSLEALWTNLYAEKFTSFVKHPSLQLDPPKLPSWKEVRDNVIPALSRIKFSRVNSETKEDLDFAGTPEGLVVIAVGGDRLSRGLTLEGLSTSYFLRGARAYDTLMQMGRWFGYRPGYAHFCRVYAPSAIVDNFRTIALATEELRREFGRMIYLGKSPHDYGLRIREPRADLLVTALNKMRRGESVRIHFAESLISSLEIPCSELQPNFEAFSSLVDALERDCGGAGVPDLEDTSTFLWHDVEWEKLVPFFSSYAANSNPCLARAHGKSLLQTYIESVRRHGDLASWTVAVIGSKQGVKAIAGRKYLTVNRNREDRDASSVKFKSVAMGGDERLDLSLSERKLAEDLKGSYKTSAAAFRSLRPSNRGLLLIYPIVPRRKKMDGAQAAPEPEWSGPPVIGIAVSLPSSQYDSGCDYVCNPNKMKEMFGSALSDDLYRDAEEEEDTSP